MVDARVLILLVPVIGIVARVLVLLVPVLVIVVRVLILLVRVLGIVVRVLILVRRVLASDTEPLMSEPNWVMGEATVVAEDSADINYI